MPQPILVAYATKREATHEVADRFVPHAAA